MLFPENHNYINLHTHKSTRLDDEYSVINVFARDLQEFSFAENQAYSIGLHPWHLEDIDADIDGWLKSVEELASHPSVIAIGEAGLDRNSENSLRVQTEVFLAHTKIAEQVKKPLVIHCVRAYEELLELKKEIEPKVPWIIHNLYSNKQMSEKLVKAGFVVSIGHGLFSPNSKIPDIFVRFDDGVFLLETDELDMSIAQVYAKAAEFRRCSIDQLKAQMAFNFKNCFAR